MTRVAFYAPLKPPTHETPSGDREMARNLMAMMAHDGARVSLVSELRLYDKTGDADTQVRLRQQAADEAERLIRDMPETDLWVTYHNYYKAPDLVGPAVCAARGIPYVQLESTRANKRLTGPWTGFARAAHDACDAAKLIFCFTEQDRLALDRDLKAGQLLVQMPPFLPGTDLPAPSDLSGPMLSVGMMRPGDKLASYRIIAETLSHLSGDWQLDIAGDGPARSEVEDLMRPFGSRVRFLSRLDRAQLSAAYQKAGLFLWPGVNEAFGMVYLEAQAHGLPVVAQDRPGVRDVLAPGSYPGPDEGSAALARRLETLLSDPAARQVAGQAARAHILSHHLMSAAAHRFWSAVSPLLKGRP